MAAAFVQGKGVTSDGVSSIQLTFDSTPTAGNLIAVSANSGTSAAPTTGVTDNKGNTYTNHKDQGGPGAYGVSLWEARNIASSATFTVSWDCPDGGYPFLGISEFSGMDTTTQPDIAGASGSGTSATPTAGPTGTTATADAVAVATFGSDSGLIETVNPPSGWTMIAEEENGNGRYVSGFAYKILSATGTQTAAFSTSFSSSWAAAIVVLRGATAAATKAPPLRRSAVRVWRRVA